MKVNHFCTLRITRVCIVAKQLCIERNELSENGRWTAEIRWLPQHHVRCLVNAEDIHFVKVRCENTRERLRFVLLLGAILNQH